MQTTLSQRWELRRSSLSAILGNAFNVQERNFVKLIPDCENGVQRSHRFLKNHSNFSTANTTHSFQGHICNIIHLFIRFVKVAAQLVFLDNGLSPFILFNGFDSVHDFRFIYGNLFAFRVKTERLRAKTDRPVHDLSRRALNELHKRERSNALTATRFPYDANRRACGN